ncbi:TPA: hypothetical protein EYP45_04970 [Candidatus Peregrinibacteria bacterium]|nr:hypothetical protein [Candidatus Peregrinibacteria bacterium]
MYILNTTSPFKILLNLCIISSILCTSFTFAATKTKPNKYEDPFIEMRASIEKFNEWIDEEDENILCAIVKGNNFITFYKSQNSPLSQLREKKEEELGSNTFQDNMNDINLEIKELVDKFSINNHACYSRDYEIALVKLEQLLELQNKLLQKTQLDFSPHNKYKKENDETDFGFFTFTETTKAFNNFITKKNLIIKAIADLKKREVSPEYDFRLTESERKRIAQRAKERADSYTDDFIQAAREYIYTPILRNTIHIKKNLESLPNGRSDFDNHTYRVDYGKIISNMLSPTAQENAIKNVSENITRNDNFRNEFLENNIFIDKLIAKENAEYKQRLEEMMNMEEYIAAYDTPFAEAVVASLIPFHVTLKETEQLLIYQTDNLKYVLNRQNVEID